MQADHNDFLFNAHRPKDCLIIKIWQRMSEAQKNYIIQKHFPGPGQSRTEGPDPQGGKKFPPQHYGSIQVERKINIFVKKETYKLQTYRWPVKEGKPKAVAFMFHGLNAYSDHGAHIAERFAEQGIETVAYDALGFGRSEAQQQIYGYVQNLEVLVKDAQDFIEHIADTHKEYAGLPRFAIGLSMGGLTIFQLCVRNYGAFDAVAMMSPAIMNPENFSILKKIDEWENLTKDKLGQCAYSIDKIKTKKHPGNPDTSAICSNKAAIRNQKKDSLNRIGYVVKSSASMLLKVMSEITKHNLSHPTDRIKNFDVPFCYFQGGKDILVNQMAGTILIENAESKDQSELHFYPDAMHDLWHEQEIPEMIEHSIKFFKKFMNESA